MSTVEIPPSAVPDAAGQVAAGQVAAGVSKSVAAPGGVRHIPSLDGIRALSFMLVFVGHAGLGDVVPGGLGVTIFFFLSGLLITTLMRVEYDKRGFVNLKHFWLRRALRILPPFYLVLAAAVILALSIAPRSKLSIAGLAAQAFHVSNYWIIYHGYKGLPVGAGTGVYWSLAVEEHFYLLFPWIYIALRGRGLSNRGQAAVLGILCALVLIWRTVLVLQWHVPTDRTYMGTDTRVDSILFGCILAVWYNPTLDRWQADERRWKWIYVPAAVCLLVATLVYRGAVFRETARYSLQGLALMPIFIAAVRFPSWAVFRWLNWRPMAFLGVLSYSLYLLHYGFLLIVQALIPAAGAVFRGIVALAMSIVVAWAIYVAVERPCAVLRRRLTN